VSRIGRLVRQNSWRGRGQCYDTTGRPSRRKSHRMREFFLRFTLRPTTVEHCRFNPPVGQPEAKASGRVACGQSCSARATNRVRRTLGACATLPEVSTSGQPTGGLKNQCSTVVGRKRCALVWHLKNVVFVPLRRKKRRTSSGKALSIENSLRMNPTSRHLFRTPRYLIRSPNYLNASSRHARKVRVA